MIRQYKLHLSQFSSAAKATKVLTMAAVQKVPRSTKFKHAGIALIALAIVAFLTGRYVGHANCVAMPTGNPPHFRDSAGAHPRGQLRCAFMGALFVHNMHAFRVWDNQGVWSLPVYGQQHTRCGELYMMP